VSELRNIKFLLETLKGEATWRPMGDSSIKMNIREIGSCDVIL